jgi:tetratricopeptide (TPR) repeat protein
LFLVHPLNVEPVLWLSARKDLLAATFLFLTLLAYARYARRPTRGRYALLLAAFAGALMSKPMAVSLPVLLLILDYWPLGRWPEANEDRTKMVKLVAEKVPLFILAGLAAMLAVFSQVDVGAMGGDAAYPWSSRITNALYALATYVRRMFWPDDLAIFYPHTDGKLSWFTVGMCIVVLVAITVIALMLARRQRFILVGWLWFLTGVAPVLGFVQVGRQAMADRYFYTPGIGLLVVLVWSVYALIGLRGRLLPVRLVAAGAAATFAILSSQQVATWRNSETAFSRALAVTHRNYIAHGNLAAHYFVQGDLTRAREHCVESLHIAPLQFTAWNNLGAIEAALGEEKAALHAYERAVMLDPKSAKAVFHFGELLARVGQREAAEAMLRRAEELEPRWDAPRTALSALQQ